MLLALTALPALAHVGMEDPPPRYPTDGFSANKACPCGSGSNNGTCTAAGAPTSDPNRSATVTTYQAGDTITVVAHEVVGHSGRWRIAFDPDGADQADFDANILLDIPDPAGGVGNVDGSDTWEFEVTLPNTPCTNCTLQLLQVMNGNTTDPVPSPIGQSTYWQCADIVLEGGSPPAHTGGETDADTDADTDSDTDADADTDADTDADSGPAAVDEEKGCGCDASGAGSAALLLFLPWLRRRR